MTTTTLAIPACPDWCDGLCRGCDCDCERDCRLLHTQEDRVVRGINPINEGPRAGEPNRVMVALERQDTETAAGDIYLHLDLEQHSLFLTPDQAREFARVLTRLAKQGESR